MTEVQKFIIMALAGLMIVDMIISDYREKTAAAEAEQERYDREFAAIAENYTSE